jgi:hypothetical protein
MAFKGVRSSCETFARNSLLALFARNSSAERRSSSRDRSSLRAARRRSYAKL